MAFIVFRNSTSRAFLKLGKISKYFGHFGNYESASHFVKLHSGHEIDLRVFTSLIPLLFTIGIPFVGTLGPCALAI